MGATFRIEASARFLLRLVVYRETVSSIAKYQRPEFDGNQNAHVALESSGKGEIRKI